MAQNIRIPAGGGDVELINKNAAVHVVRTWAHAKYGYKLGIELPVPWEDADAKEAFKDGLAWEETHRSWNDTAEEWEADLDALNQVVAVMTDAGYDVTVPVTVASEFQRHGNSFLPGRRKAVAVDEERARVYANLKQFSHVRVVYDSTQSDEPQDVTGEVREVRGVEDEERESWTVVFETEDGRELVASEHKETGDATLRRRLENFGLRRISEEDGGVAVAVHGARDEAERALRSESECYGPECRTQTRDTFCSRECREHSDSVAEDATL